MPAIPVQKFSKHCQTLLARNCRDLRTEFDSLELSDRSAGNGVGASTTNSWKNRYCNIIPYDETRVVLQEESKEDGKCDYVNANYVSGFYSEKEYIAAQGPLENTVDDFWKMCHQSGSKCIVMLTEYEHHGYQLCYPYLPPKPGLKDEETETFGDIRVKIVSETTKNYNPLYSWKIRELVVENGKGLRREMRHYHFQNWRDYDHIPEQALLALIKDVREFSPSSNSYNNEPIIVHCSAGVGRTGTFIATDIAVSQTRYKGTVDIPGIVKKMRKERMWMVQTLEQYSMIYKCVLQALEDRAAMG